MHKLEKNRTFMLNSLRNDPRNKTANTAHNHLMHLHCHKTITAQPFRYQQSSHHYCHRLSGGQRESAMQSTDGPILVEIFEKSKTALYHL